MKVGAGLYDLLFHMLGQVYRVRVKRQGGAQGEGGDRGDGNHGGRDGGARAAGGGGEVVALKVQRPDMIRAISLDLYILRK